MKGGFLYRDMTVKMENGNEFQIQSTRINSMHDKDVGAYRYTITPISSDATIEIISYLDFDVSNKDSNYDEKFWIGKCQAASEKGCYTIAETKKTEFVVGVAMQNIVSTEETIIEPIGYDANEKQSIAIYKTQVNKGQTLKLDKFAIVGSSLNIEKENIKSYISKRVVEVSNQGWDYHFTEHKNEWTQIWSLCDITIGGDTAAQQGIRFNIFQLFQTYTGDDYRLNIGPKGFTGEKYGGSTYWDTEAYCIPFYLGTAAPTVARNLLIYRYNHLDKAIKNAEKLGFVKGAALYPMVTMNGEECHNEWEITFEEIHRNGAIAFAIYDYIRYTDDKSYLEDYGAEVLLAIARFWAQRVNWSTQKQQYVILGVTGPNEYENNVNNNWYTNYIAAWCLSYAKDSLIYVKENNKNAYDLIINKASFSQSEIKIWDEIIEKMYYPMDESKNIFLQQDGFLDKEQMLVSDLDAEDRPLNQKWSWDRILRSVFIKQADVLQGMYFFEDDFDINTHRRNFEYYEPRTVHESSLSPCVHSILATKLGMEEKAYEMYLRTSRLDLDDYNNDTEDGCHITSMAGTWLAIVKGFAGQRVVGGKLSFSPVLPSRWSSLGFNIKFRGCLFQIQITKDKINITNHSETDGQLLLFGELIKIGKLSTLTTSLHSSIA